MARGEHLSGRGLPENPFAGLVAAPPEVGRVAHPVVVHVDAQRRGGGVESEAARLERHLLERHARPAELLRDRHEEVPRSLELVEVLLTEAVLSVVERRSFAALLEKCIREQWFRRDRDAAPPEISSRGSLERPNSEASAERVNLIRAAGTPYNLASGRPHMPQPAAQDPESVRLEEDRDRDENGRRPVYGGAETFQSDPHWRDYVLFYEYFHGDIGAGLGASHQTGWTGLVAKLLQQSGE
jgi:hypothetical protein